MASEFGGVRREGFVDKKAETFGGKGVLGAEVFKEGEGTVGISEEVAEEEEKIGMSVDQVDGLGEREG